LLISFDAVVVGAGIAGASVLLALPVSHGLKVAVIAPPQIPGFRIGESLPPAAREELKRLDIYDEFVAEVPTLEANRKFSAWGSPVLREQGNNPPFATSGLSIDREFFQQWIWQHAKRKVHFTSFAHTVASVSKQKHGWSVKLTDGSTLNTTFLLDASGRKAVVARDALQRQKLDKLVCVYSEVSPLETNIERTPGPMVEAQPAGWFYSALLPNQKLVLAFFTDADLLRDGVHRDAEAFYKRVRESVFNEKRRETGGYDRPRWIKVVDAATSICKCLHSEGLLAVGDAAFSVDPLSSHGITTALWSGRKVGAILPQVAAGDTASTESYVGAFEKGIQKILQEHQLIHQLEQRWPQEPFWARRHRSDRES